MFALQAHFCQMPEKLHKEKSTKKKYREKQLLPYASFEMI